MLLPALLLLLSLPAAQHAAAPAPTRSPTSPPLPPACSADLPSLPGAPTEACPFTVAPSTKRRMVCAGHGTCLLNHMCQCDPGWIGMDCATPSSKMQVLGNVVITQQALAQVPSRYTSLITDTYRNLEADALLQGIPAYTDASQCTYFIARSGAVSGPSQILITLLNQTSSMPEPAPIAVTIVQDGIQVTAAFKIRVPSIPLDVYASTVPGTRSCCDEAGSPIFAERVACTAVCDSTTGARASLSFNATVTATLKPVFADGVAGFTVQDYSIQTLLLPSDLGFTYTCSQSTEYSTLLYNLGQAYAPPIGEIVGRAAAQALRDAVSAQVGNFSLGTVYNATDTVKVRYFVRGATFHPPHYMVLKLVGQWSKSRLPTQCPTQVVTTYVDTAAETERLQSPQANWDSRLTETTVAPSKITGASIALMGGMRISRSFLRGAMWAAFVDRDVSGLTSYALTGSVLDAQYDLHVAWRFPSFGFPRETGASKSTFRLTIDSGEMTATCRNTNSTDLEASFASIWGNCRLVLYTTATSDSDRQYWLYPSLYEWDTSRINLNLTRPNLPLPNTLVGGLFNDAAKERLIRFNDQLRSNAVLLPTSITNMLPSARVELYYSELQSPDMMNGFLELSSRCACGYPPQELAFVYTNNAKVGEYMEGCVLPCAPSLPPAPAPSPTGSNNSTTTTTTRLLRHRQRQRRELQQSQQQPPLCPSITSPTQLKTAAGLLFKCMQRGRSYDLAYGRWKCMLEAAPQFSLGACDPRHETGKLATCTTAIRPLLNATFDYVCVNDESTFYEGYNCDEPISAMYTRTCRCALNPPIPCTESSNPIIAAAVGAIASPVCTVFALLILRVTNPAKFKEVTLRRKMRFRDRFICLTLLACSVVFYVLVGFWTFTDPFREFVSQSQRNPAFTSTWVSITYDQFFLGWSLGALFTASYMASNLFLLSTWALYVGEAMWLKPSGAVHMPDGTVRRLSPEHVASKARSAAIFFVFLRLQPLLLVGVLSIPPVFFPFLSSVLVQKPFYQDAFSSFVNATAVSGGQESLDHITFSESTLSTVQKVLSLSVLGRATGFLSCGIVFVVCASIPGGVLAAQTVLWMIDGRLQLEKEEYAKHAGVLPPPDHTELRRVKRILLLFQWSIHGVGAISTAVPTIFLYQSLGASVGFVVSWVCCWVVPIPLLVLVTGRWISEQRSRRVQVSVLYFLIFAGCAGAMATLIPLDAGFTPWFAYLILAGTFLLVFCNVLCEFINVDAKSVSALAPQSRSMRLKKVRLLQHLGIDVVGSPQLLTQDLDLTNLPSPGYRAMMSPVSPSLQQRQNQQQPQRKVPAFRLDGDASGSPPGASQSRSPAPARPERTARVDQSYSRFLASDESFSADALAVAAERLRRKNDAARRVQELRRQEAAASQTVQLQQQSSGFMPVLGPQHQQQYGGANATGAAGMGGGGGGGAGGGPLPRSRGGTFASGETMLEQQQYRNARRISRRLAERGVRPEQIKELTERITEFQAARDRPIMSMASSVAPVMWQARTAAVPHPQQQQQQQQQAPPPSQPRPALQPQHSASSLASAGPGHSHVHAPGATKRVAPASPTRTPNSRPQPQQQQQPPPPRVALPPSSSPTPLYPGGGGGNVRAEDRIFMAQFSDQTTAGPNIQPAESFGKWLSRVFAVDLIAIRVFLVDTASYLRKSAKWAVDRIRYGTPPGGDVEDHRVGGDGMMAREDSAGSAGAGAGAGGRRRPIANRFRDNLEYTCNRVFSRATRGWIGCRPVFAGLYDFVTEAREQRDPYLYGVRAPYRRLLLVFGGLFCFTGLFNTTQNSWTLPTLRAYLVSQFTRTSSSETGYTWPFGDNFTTIVDDPLRTYVQFSYTANNLFWFALLLIGLSIATDSLSSLMFHDARKVRQGLAMSQILSFASLPFAFVGVLTTSVPNYTENLAAQMLGLSFCGPELSASIRSLARDLLGISLGGLVLSSLMVTLLLVVPAVVRASVYILYGELKLSHQEEVLEPRKSFAETRKRVANIRLIFRLFPILGPVVTFIPLLLVAQFVGKVYSAVLIVFHWQGPIFAASLGAGQAWPERGWNFFIIVYIWSVVYYLPLAIIIFVEALDTGYWGVILGFTLTDPVWWIYTAGITSFALVVGSDLLYFFLAHDEKLEEDRIIDEYLDALKAEAVFEANVPLLLDTAALAPPGASFMRDPTMSG